MTQVREVNCMRYRFTHDPHPWGDHGQYACTGQPLPERRRLDRPTASTITDAQLDALHAELAQLRVFRDIVYLEAEHWDDGSKNVICAAVDEYGTPTALDGAQQPETARQDGHAGACGPLTTPGGPEPAEPANGRQAGVQPLDYPDAAANAEAENAWRQGEDHL